MKNIRVFYLKIFNFLEVKCSIYLNRRIFVMRGTDCAMDPSFGFVEYNEITKYVCLLFYKCFIVNLNLLGTPNTS